MFARPSCLLHHLRITLHHVSFAPQLLQRLSSQTAVSLICSSPCVGFHTNPGVLKGLPFPTYPVSLSLPLRKPLSRARWNAGRAGRCLGQYAILSTRAGVGNGLLSSVSLCAALGNPALMVSPITSRALPHGQGRVKRRRMAAHMQSPAIALRFLSPLLYHGATSHASPAVLLSFPGANLEPAASSEPALRAVAPEVQGVGALQCTCGVSKVVSRSRRRANSSGATVWAGEEICLGWFERYCLTIRYRHSRLWWLCQPPLFWWHKANFAALLKVGMSSSVLFPRNHFQLCLHC